MDNSMNRTDETSDVIARVHVNDDAVGNLIRDNPIGIFGQQMATTILNNGQTNSAASYSDWLDDFIRENPTFDFEAGTISRVTVAAEPIPAEEIVTEMVETVVVRENSQHYENNVIVAQVSQSGITSNLAHQRFHFIAYDLETTNIWNSSEITHIAAISSNGHFERFIVPMGDIHPKAAALTGLVKRSDETGQEVLLRHGVKMETVSLEDALATFLEFLELQVIQCGDSASVVVIGHNGNRFDAPIVAYWLNRIGLTSHPVLKRVQFGDSLRLVTSIHQGGHVRFDGGLKLGNVFKKMYPDESFEAHGALEDSRAVLKVITGLIGMVPMENIQSGLALIHFNEIQISYPRHKKSKPNTKPETKVKRKRNILERL